MPQPNPAVTVSVIIAAFNAEAYLAETLDSILSQEIDGLEVIVIDDGSTDNTQALASEYVPRIRIASQRNSGGCSSPRNHGARIAKGRYLKFFDSDDILPPDTLRVQVDFLESHMDLGMMLTDYRNFSESGPWAETHFATCPRLLKRLSETGSFASAIVGPPEATRLLAKENFAIAGTPLWRSETFHELGGFDESLNASEDFDICYRHARSHPIGIIGHVGMLRRLHAGNLTSQSDRMLQYRIASRAKLVSRETDPQSTRQLREYLADRYLERANLLAARGDPGAFTQLANSVAHRPWPTLRGIGIGARVIFRLAYRALPPRY